MDIQVSIIIVNYNSLNLLKNCIKSIIKYTNNISYEIIVIDNNSNEDVEIVTNKFYNINLIKNNTNVGFAAANNQGIKKAKGKYILFLNNDTIFIEDSIKKVFDFAESLTEPIFIGCQLLNRDNSRQESIVEFPSVWNTFTESFFLYKIFSKSKLFNKYYLNFNYVENPVEVDVIKGAFMFCNAEEIRKLNGFDEKYFFYSEETDLCYRFKKGGGKVYFIPYTSIIHIGGTTSIKNWRFVFLNQAKSKIHYFKEHFNNLNFLIASFIYFSGVLTRIPLYFIGGVFFLNNSLLVKSKCYYLQLIHLPKFIFSEYGI